MKIRKHFHAVLNLHNLRFLEIGFKYDYFYTFNFMSLWGKIQFHHF